MPVSVTCPLCESRLKVGDELAGKAIACPKCEARVEVPAAAPAPKPSARPLRASPQQPAAPRVPEKPAVDLRKQILQGFRGEIEPVKVPLTYQLGVLLNTIVMLILPLVYVALIVLACWGLWWHLAHNHTWMQGVRGRAAGWVLMAYLAPGIVGGIVILFMIKPLFAPAARSGRTRSITRKSDPLLFEFVERISDAVGAPRPTRIDLDCDVNASAGFRRGWLSLFLPSDLVLRIGLPLVAGMSLQQFAGVLAHEFGHFSQGVGMRLTYVVRSVMFWFIRVVFERDAWDEWLVATSQEIDLRIGWILWLAMFCVWITRQVLRLLMNIGLAVCGFMLRQMEYDADRYEARMAGSDTFETTTRRLKTLVLATQGAQVDLLHHLRQERLPDNVPKLIMEHVDTLPPKAMKVLKKAIEEERTGLFDSHPSDRDRIDNARREAAPGVFRSDLPARVLLRDFDEASRKVTADWYHDLLGYDVKPNELVATEALIGQAAPSIAEVPPAVQI